MKKFLLTGGQGMLAGELLKKAKEYCIEYIPIDKDDVDIGDEERMSKFYHDNWDMFLSLDGVVHCAAYTNVPRAEDERRSVIRSNIDGTRNVSNVFCAPQAIKMVYISTDYIYPGDTGNYKETDMPRPINFYAFTKLAGEVYTDEKHDLIIRTSFKPKRWPYPKAFDDLYTSADYVDVIAKRINFMICEKAQGIYNIGTERKSIYDLARRRNPRVKPMSREEITNVYLPKDTSMNIDKYNDFCNRLMED